MFLAVLRNKSKRNGVACQVNRARARLLKVTGFWPLLERLEDRTIPAIIHWTNPAGGLWNVAANWDLRRVPAAGDDVLIDLPGSYTVTCNNPSQAKSVLSDHPFTLASTLLEVTEQFRVDSAFQLVNGTLRGATVSGGTTVQVLGPNGALWDVTLNGSAIVPGSSSLTLTGNWRNNGVITLAGGDLNLGGTFTLAALGDFRRLSGSVSIVGRLDNRGTTLGLNDTTGSWNLSNGVIEGGTVTTTGSARLLVNGFQIGGWLDGVTVNGSVQVGSTYGLTVVHGLTLNGGLDVAGGGLFFPGTQTLAGTGSVTFIDTSGPGARIGADGTLTIGPSITVTARNGFGRIVNFVNRGRIILDGTGSVSLEGSNWRNEGQIGLTSGTLNLGGTFTLSALGTLNRGFLDRTFVNLTGTLDNRGTTLTLNRSTGPWTLADGTILGGLVTSADLPTPLSIAAGKMGALDGVTLNTNLEVASNQTLIFAGNWNNGAALTLSNGGTLRLGGTFTLATLGDFRRTGGTLFLEGTFNNQGGTLALAGPNGSWRIRGGMINGGTVSTSGGARLLVMDFGLPSRLNGITMDGDLTVMQGQFGGSILLVTNGLRLDGTLTVVTDSTGGSTVRFDGSQTLSGKGLVVFSGFGTGLVEAMNGVTTFGSGITVRGGLGELSNIINQGTIELPNMNSGITLSGDAWRNQGTIQLDAGILSLNGTFPLAALGSIQRTGGNIDLVGTLDNRGTTLALSSRTGSWRLRGSIYYPIAAGTILGGSVTAMEGATLVLPSSAAGTLNGVQLNAPVDVSPNTTLTLTGLWTNRGTLRVTGGTLNLGGIFTTSSLGTLLRTDGTVNLTGTLENAGRELLLNAQTGSWSLARGTIHGGSVRTDGVALLSTAGGTLDGVTMNGSVQLQGGGLAVVNGLTLNGNLDLGIYDTVAFVGSQLLDGSGTILMPTLNNWLLASSGTVTFGPGIMVRGNGNIAGFVNQGTISATTTGANLTLSNFVNQGTIAVSTSSGTVFLSGTRWRNEGELQLTGGTLSLGGRFTLADLGKFEHPGGSIAISGTLDNQGKTFTLDASTGSWTLNNGTILGGTVTTRDGAYLLLGPFGGTLNGVSLETGVTIPTNSSLTFTGVWQNHGQLTLNGNGTLNLGGTFTQAALGNFVRTGGTVNLTGMLDNTGDMLALNDTTGSWRVNGGTLTGGTVTTVGSARLFVAAGRLNAVTVNGTIDATNATFTVSNGLTLNGMLTLAGTATFEGAQSLTGTATVVLASSFTTLRGTNGQITLGPNVLLRGSGHLVNFVNQGTIEISDANAMLTLEGEGWRNNGILRLSNGTLSLAGTFTTAGLGTLQRTGGSVYLLGTLDNRSATLALSDMTGSWYLVGGIIWGGTVTSSGGATIVPAGSFVTSILDSVHLEANVEIVNGATLLLAGAWNNRGSIMVGNGSTLRLGGTFTTAEVGNVVPAGGTVRIGGTLENVGRTLALDARTGSWVLDGGTIDGGSVTTTGGARLRAGFGGSFQPGRLNGVTVNGDLEVQNGSLAVTGGLTINGSVLLGDQDFATGGITFSGSQTLAGTATLVFGNSRNTFFDARSGMVTIGPGITLRGAVGHLADFVNQGTILIDVDGADARLEGHFWRNAGVIRLTAGTLNLGGTFTTTALGDFQRTGGTVNLIGTLNNADSTLRLDSGTGSWILQRGTIIGGQVIVSASAALSFAPEGGTLDGVLLQGNIDVVNNATLNYSGMWRHQGRLNVLNGTVNLGGFFTPASLPDFRHTGGTINLTGNLDIGGGTFSLDANTGSWNLAGGTMRMGTVTCTEGSRLSAQGVQSGGFITVTLNCDLDVVNSRLNVGGDMAINGAVSLGGDGSFGALLFPFSGPNRLLGSGTIIFRGTDSARNAVAQAGIDTFNTVVIGPGLTIRGTTGFVGYSPTYSGSLSVTFINQGIISADTGGQTITLSGSTVLNQGTLSALGGGNLSLQQRDIMGYVANEGEVVVDLGSRLTVNANFVQIAGTTQLTGGTLATPLFDLRAGLLAGSGVIEGDLVNGGTIEVGFAGIAAGALEIHGNYTQTADGVLSVEIGGREPGTEYDTLSITGSATLAGKLQIALLDDFFAQAGDTFTLLNFRSVRGDFDTIDGLYPKGDVYFIPVLDTDNFTLYAVPY